MSIKYKGKTICGSVSGIPSGCQDTNNYSTEETVIGTWINGKPIYRKVLMVTSPTNNNATVVATQPEIEIAIKLYGMTLSAVNEPIPSHSTAFYLRTWFRCEQHQIVVQASAENGVNYLGVPMFIIIEYTKSTDIATKSSDAVSSIPKIEKTGSIEQDGQQYDYELSDDAIAQASAIGPNN